MSRHRGLQFVRCICIASLVVGVSAARLTEDRMEQNVGLSLALAAMVALGTDFFERRVQQLLYRPGDPPLPEDYEDERRDDEDD